MSNANKRIQSIISLAKARVRAQRISEGLTTGLVASALISMALLVLFKTGWIVEGDLWTWAAATLLFPLIGLAWAFSSRIDPNALAMKIDTSSELKARLTTAFCFLQVPEAERSAFQEAAIADATGHLDAVRVAPATPWSIPRSALPLVVALVALVALVMFRPPTARGMLPEPEPIPKPEAVLDDEDIKIERDKLEDLKEELEGSDDPEAIELVGRMEDLLDKVEEREITKEDFIEEVDEIKDEYFKPRNEEWEQILEELSKVEEELEKDKNTRDLAKALKEGDMDKAAKELEKLGDKIAKGEMSDRDVEKLAKRLEKLAKQFENDSEKLNKLLKEKEKELSRLKKKLEDKKKQLTGAEKKRLSRLERQLKELGRKKKAYSKSGKGKTLKKLSKAMKTGADKARKTKKRGKGASRKKKDREAAKKDFKKAMKTASAETRDVGKKAKTGKAKKRAQRQLENMKQKMRRQAGEKDVKAQEAKAQFAQKAQGQKPENVKRAEKKAGGSKSISTSGTNAKKSGESGKKPDGPKQQGEVAGDAKAESKGESDLDLLGEGKGEGKGNRELGEATDMKDKKVVDKNVQGREGEGPTSSEVVESAAQEGFASTPYQEAYEYEKRVAEEVLAEDQIPPGYRFYIERYFENIRPRDVAE